MGATEGNICALWQAREYLTGRPLKYGHQNDTEPLLDSALPPVVFFTESTHYSILKACNILRLQRFDQLGRALGDCPLSARQWPNYVPSNADGSVYIPSLFLLVRFFVKRGYPVILCFNYGSTFTGAFDDVEHALQMLSPLLKEKKCGRRHYWVHVDGALAANYAPYLQRSQADSRAKACLTNNHPYPLIKKFDFRIKQVMSICCSPYKWLGAPRPFGLYIARPQFQVSPSTQADYIGCADTTVSGSRNGLAAVLAWYQLSRLGEFGLRQRAMDNERLTQYAYQRLTTLSLTVKTLNLQPRVPFSNMLVFACPCDEIMHRFSLCSQWLQLDGSPDYVRMCHIVILSHVTRDTIEELMTALSAPDVFGRDNNSENNPANNPIKEIPIRDKQ
jgi:histidine decarboxylase